MNIKVRLKQKLLNFYACLKIGMEILSDVFIYSMHNVNIIKTRREVSQGFPSQLGEVGFSVSVKTGCLSADIYLFKVS